MSVFCSVPGCDSTKRYGRGFCNKHWKRWYKYGDPLVVRSPRGEADKFYRDVVLTYDGDECVTWPFATCRGYGHMQLGRRSVKVSRAVCEEVNGPAPSPAHEAAHSCGRGAFGCVTKGHLSWKTRAENEADKLLHGTSNRGERQWMSKLTEADVRTIMSLKGKEKQSDIAARFGVKQQAISNIHRGKTWVWLTPDKGVQGLVAGAVL